MKTATAAYNTERAKLQTSPIFGFRVFHVKNYGDGADYAFRVQFATGTITSPSKTTLLYLGRIQGGTAAVQVEQGRASVGGFQVELVDVSGEVTRYLSAPALTVKTAMTAGSPGAGGYVEVNEATDGMPFEGTLEVTTGGVIERIRYDLRDDANKRFRVATGGRGADGTTAASHGIGDPLTNGEQIRPGQRMQLFAGYAGLAEAEFMSFARMEVVARQLAADGVTWLIQCQDVQRGLRRKVFLTASAEAPVLLDGNPVDLALRVLTSTGLGTNGPYDVLPVENGLGVPQGLVDVAGLEALRAAHFAGQTYNFKLTGSADGKQWLEEAVWRSLNCYPVVTQDGKLSARRFQPAPSPGSVTETLNANDLINAEWITGDPMIVNQVLIQLDWDLPSAPEKFGLARFYSFDASKAKYGPRPVLTLQLPGVKSNGSTSNSNMLTIIDDRAYTIGKRFAEPPPALRCRVFYRNHLWEVGDLLKVTYGLVPNLKTGRRGLTDEVFEIVDMTPRFPPSGGYLELTLLHTGAIAVPSAPTGGAFVALRRGVQEFAGETWEAGTSAPWILVQAGTGASEAITQNGQTGGKALQCTGEIWRVYQGNIPFDPGKLYRVRARARRRSSAGPATRQEFFCGVEGVAGDGVTLINTSGANAHTNQHYIAAASADMKAWTTDAWMEFTGWFKGHAVTGDGAAHPNATDPGKLQDAVRYFRPLFILNYKAQDPNDLNAVGEIDMIAVDVFDEEKATTPGTPPAPTFNSEGTYVASDGTTLAFIALNISALPAGAKYQNVLRRVSGTGAFQLVAQLEGAATGLRSDELTPGIAYEFAVTAFSAFGVPSALSGVLSRTAPGDTSPPATPANLTATGMAGQIALDWDDNTELDFSEYRVWRHMADVPASAVAIADVRASRFIDTTATPGTPYWYWVSAFDRSENQSAKSTSATATASTVASTAPPSSPTAATKSAEGTVQASDGSTRAWIIVNRPALPSGAAYMNGLIKLNGLNDWTIADQTSFGGGTTLFDDLTPGKLYDVGYQAFSGGGGASAIVTASDDPYTALGDTTPPAVPAQPTAVVGTGKGISLDWADNTDTDLGQYGVYRHTADVPASAVLIAKTKTSRFVDLDVTIGTPYYYWLTAFDWTGNESAKSLGSGAVTPTLIPTSQASTTAPSTPSAPVFNSEGTYLASDGTAKAFISLNISALPSGSTYQNVKQRVSGTGEFQTVAQLNSAATGLRIDDLTPGVAYQFVVQAYSAFGIASSESGTLSRTAPGDTTAPADPSAIAVRQSGAKIVEIEVTHAEPSDWAFNELYRNTSNDSGTATLIDKQQAKRFTDQNIAYAATYYYWVKVVDFTGNKSGFSPSAGHSVTVAKIVSGDLSVAKLSHITPDVGTLTAGIVQNAGGDTKLDLDAGKLRIKSTDASSKEIVVGAPDPATATAGLDYDNTAGALRVVGDVTARSLSLLGDIEQGAYVAIGGTDFPVLVGTGRVISPSCALVVSPANATRASFIRGIRCGRHTDASVTTMVFGSGTADDAILNLIDGGLILGSDADVNTAGETNDALLIRAMNAIWPGRVRKISWTGDGSSPRAFTGVGFQPQWVIALRAATAGSNLIFVRSPSFASTDSRRVTDRVIDAQGIRSLDSDGFTVGSNLNVSTAVYSAVCIAASQASLRGKIRQFSYRGNGSATQSGAVDFASDFALIWASMPPETVDGGGNAQIYVRTPDFAVNESMRLSGGGVVTTGIRNNGATLEVGIDLNASNVIYEALIMANL